jgi:hypothetical protein
MKNNRESFGSKQEHLYIISGGARTFLQCFDKCYENIITKLSEGANVSILFYLKLIDIGPKGQENWNFEYEDVEYSSVMKKIKGLDKNVTVYYKILDDNEISDDKILSLVKKRSKYIDFLSEDKMLIRVMHFYYNIKRCKNMIDDLDKKFDYYIYIRPDLYFTEEAKPITHYNINKIAISSNGPNGYNDHFFIIPHKDYNTFFNLFDVFLNNTTISYVHPENLTETNAKPEILDLPSYYIKRS